MSLTHSTKRGMICLEDANQTGENAQMIWRS